MSEYEADEWRWPCVRADKVLPGMQVYECHNSEYVMTVRHVSKPDVGELVTIFGVVTMSLDNGPHHVGEDVFMRTGRGDGVMQFTEADVRFATALVADLFAERGDFASAFRLLDEL